MPGLQLSGVVLRRGCVILTLNLRSQPGSSGGGTAVSREQCEQLLSAAIRRAQMASQLTQGSVMQVQVRAGWLTVRALSNVLQYLRYSTSSVSPTIQALTCHKHGQFLYGVGAPGQPGIYANPCHVCTCCDCSLAPPPGPRSAPFPHQCANACALHLQTEGDLGCAAWDAATHQFHQTSPESSALAAANSSLALLQKHALQCKLLSSAASVLCLAAGASTRQLVLPLQLQLPSRSRLLGCLLPAAAASGVSSDSEGILVPGMQSGAAAFNVCVLVRRQEGCYLPVTLKLKECDAPSATARDNDADDVQLLGVEVGA